MPSHGTAGHTHHTSGARGLTRLPGLALLLTLALVLTGAGPAAAVGPQGAPTAELAPTVAGVEVRDLPGDPALEPAREPAPDRTASPEAGTTANDAGIRLGATSASVWDMARAGLQVHGWSFTPGQQVTVSINDEAVGRVPVDAAGEVGFSFTAEMAPGQYRIRLAQGEDSVQATLTVVADSRWYTWVTDPYVLSEDRVFTQAELRTSPPEYTVYDLEGNAPVDIVVNGRVVETQTTNSLGLAEYVLSAPRDPGTYTVTFAHPAGSVSATAVVVPDTHGAAPGAGTYTGDSLQTHSGGGLDPDPETRPFSFTVTADGKVTAVTGGYSWVCRIPPDHGLPGFGRDDFASHPIPPTRVTAGRPFEITWADGDYTFYGTIGADGTAAGDIRFNHGACGFSQLDWSTSRGGQSGSTPFPDVPRDAWYFAPVNWMVGRGMTHGYSDGTFRPYRDVTRAEAVTFLYRYTDPDFTVPTTARFPDVPVRHNHFASVSWATATGVVKGYSDGTFKPTRTMTRGEVALILYRRADPAHTPPARSPFTDVRPGDGYYDAVTWLYGHEITQGLAGGRFGVREPVTRGQIATFLHRYDRVVGG